MPICNLVDPPFLGLDMSYVETPAINPISSHLLQSMNWHKPKLDIQKMIISKTIKSKAMNQRIKIIYQSWNFTPMRVSFQIFQSSTFSIIGTSQCVSHKMVCMEGQHLSLHIN